MNSVVAALEALIGVRIECERLERRLGEARDTAADISHARRDIGFEPSYEFVTGLEAQLDWQRARVAEFETIRD